MPPRDYCIISFGATGCWSECCSANGFSNGDRTREENRGEWFGSRWLPHHLQAGSSPDAQKAPIGRVGGLRVHSTLTPASCPNRRLRQAAKARLAGGPTVPSVACLSLAQIGRA